MTDEEIIAWINEAGDAWQALDQAADRIEALVKERDRAWQEADAWSGKYGWAVRDKEAAEARAERLEDALKRARDFIERGGRDRIGPVLRQIDAALKGDQK